MVSANWGVRVVGPDQDHWGKFVFWTWNFAFAMPLPTKEKSFSCKRRKKNMKKCSCFFNVYKASEGKCWQARGARFTLLPLRVSFLTRVSTRPEKTERKQQLFWLSREKKNLSFSNNLLMFSEEHADMHV